MVAVTSVARVAPAKQKEGEIWLRPIKQTVEKDINGKRYNFYSGEIVRVQGERNGNIIIGEDTLPTDEACLTDSKRGWVVDSMYLASFSEFGKCFIPIDSTRLQIDLRDMPRKGYLRIYNPTNMMYVGIPYGSMDTLDITNIGLKPYESKLRYVPDSIYGGEIDLDYASLHNGGVANELDESDKDNYTRNLIGIVLLIVIAGGILFIALRKIKEKKDAKAIFIKSINKLQDNVASLYHDLVPDNSQDGINLNGTIERLNNTAEYLKNVLENMQTDNIRTSIDFNPRIEEVNSSVNNIKKIRKSYEDIKNSTKEITTENVGDGFLNCQKNLKNQCELSNDFLSKLIGLIASEETLDNNFIKEPFASGESDLNVSSSQDQSIKNNDTECSILRRENARISQELNKTQDDNEKLKKSLNEERESRNNLIKVRVAEAQEKFEKTVRRIENEANEKIRVSKEKAERAENKAKTIADELNNKFDKERIRYVEEKKTLNTALTDTKKQLNKTAVDLSSEISAHNTTKRIVAQLTAETNAFKDHLSGVTDSIPYCERIYDLIKLSVDMQATASDILESDLSDPYFAYKAVALFNSKLNSINLPAFYTDVEMVAKTGFVIKGTPLAAYDKKKSAKELENLTKNYFFTTYLKTYVDALLVLNESLIGLKYLIGDVKPSHIRTLEEYRGRIQTIVQKLGIQVLTVRIFDSVGVNTDLLATEIDAGYDKHGAILEIENCKVSLIGGMPDNQRIIVKIQK